MRISAISSRVMLAFAGPWSGGTRRELVHQPLRHEGDHGDQGAVPQGQLILLAPHLAEEHIVIQLSELGSKLPKASRPAVCFTAIWQLLLCKRK